MSTGLCEPVRHVAAEAGGPLPDGRRLRVLVLSRNYPNPVLDRLGLWVQRQTHALAGAVDVTVMSPVPYWPPVPGPAAFRRFRTVPSRRLEGAVVVEHPRLVIGPGYSTHALEARSYFRAVSSRAARAHEAKPFDVIHAHFSYPDGVAAVRLGAQLGVPVVVTEHNLWRPWMEAYPRVRRQTVEAMQGIAAHVVVSRAVQHSIEQVAGRPSRFRVIPIGVDGKTFPAGPGADARVADEVLFVGWVNHVKGVDVLLHAIARLRPRRPGLHLTIVGGALYRHTGVQERQLRALAAQLGVGDAVTFAGPKPAEEVAALMRRASVLAVSSRRESCGAVILEAFASGLPVVSTACGGPEDLVRPDTGVLVPPEDADALADGLDRVLSARMQFDPAALRRYALDGYSWDRLAVQYLEVYRGVVRDRVSRRSGVVR